MELTPGGTLSLGCEITKIQEVSERYGISRDTLRYYERIGPLPPVQRDKSGIRNYSELDLKQVEFIKCMRSAGLPISVTFEPGARTAWHSHPYGQTLLVTFGSGRVRRWGGPVEEIHPDDVVWIPPEEKHWHGAAPTTAMTHLSIIEQVPGKAPTWLEKVSNEQYRIGE